MENFNASQTIKKTFKPLLKTQNLFFTWITTGLVLLLPLFFLPITTDFYLLNKSAFFILVVGLMLIVWAVKTLLSQKMALVKTPLNWLVLVLMVSYILSSYIVSPNLMASLTGPVTRIIFLGFLYFVIVNQIRERQAVKKVLVSLISSSVILSWLTIFTFLGILEKTGVAWLQNQTWTPTGSALITAQLMAILIPATWYWAFKNKEAWQKILLFMAGILQIISLILILTLFFQKKLVLSYLSPVAGWKIAVEGLKTFQTAVLGVGPDNFLSAFNLFRPLELNQGQNWNIKFLANSNQFLHLLSTVGVLGLMAYLFLILKSLKKENFKGRLLDKIVYLTLLANLVIQLFFTANFLLLAVTFICLGLMQTLKAGVENRDLWQIKGSWPISLLAGAVILLTLFLGYWQIRLWLADQTFYQSLLAAQANKGVETYNLQVKAIRFNGFNENYRITYANTNLALANSLASQKDITDQDRASIQQLLSQAIREAKAAINLNPQISAYWLNLARLYQSIINANNEAADWAAAAYLQAVQTDPTNPTLRVDFGGLFFSLKLYDRAVNQFTQAANLKPDYANAYYNLASTYKALEDWPNAQAALEQTLNLLPANSQDRSLVEKEMAEVKANLPEPSQETVTAPEEKTTKELTKPAPVPSPNAKVGEVKLPPDAAPEIPETEAGEEATASAKP